MADLQRKEGEGYRSVCQDAQESQVVEEYACFEMDTSICSSRGQQVSDAERGQDQGVSSCVHARSHQVYLEETAQEERRQARFRWREQVHFANSEEQNETEFHGFGDYRPEYAEKSKVRPHRLFCESQSHQIIDQ